MPELAEVETVRRQLNAFLPASVEQVLFRPSYYQLRKFSYQTPSSSRAPSRRDDFSSMVFKSPPKHESSHQAQAWSSLSGYTLHPFSRFGKWLWASVTRGDVSPVSSKTSEHTRDATYYLIGHLGMSGQWLIKTGANPAWDEHEHIRMRIKRNKSQEESQRKLGAHNGQDRSSSGDTQVLRTLDSVWFCYRDPRRFGHVHLATPEEFAAWEKQYQLALDPLDTQFRVDNVSLACYQFPFRPMKSLLLDQNLFPGIGNYLASEILAYGGIHPLRQAGSLSAEEQEKLYAAILQVLQISIDQGGTSFDGAYVDTYGNPGGLSHLVVYARDFCGLCANKGRESRVVRLVVQGRSTFFCSRCQS
jgi:formamidopyrimidine-DNA glycosylase